MKKKLLKLIVSSFSFVLACFLNPLCVKAECTVPSQTLSMPREIVILNEGGLPQNINVIKSIDNLTYINIPAENKVFQFTNPGNSNLGKGAPIYLNGNFNGVTMQANDSLFVANNSNITSLTTTSDAVEISGSSKVGSLKAPNASTVKISDSAGVSMVYAPNASVIISEGACIGTPINNVIGSKIEVNHGSGYTPVVTADSLKEEMDIICMYVKQYYMRTGELTPNEQSHITALLKLMLEHIATYNSMHADSRFGALNTTLTDMLRELESGRVNGAVLFNSFYIKYGISQRFNMIYEQDCQKKKEEFNPDPVLKKSTDETEVTVVNNDAAVVVPQPTPAPTPEPEHEPVP